MNDFTFHMHNHVQVARKLKKNKYNNHKQTPIFLDNPNDEDSQLLRNVGTSTHTASYSGRRK